MRNLLLFALLLRLVPLAAALFQLVGTALVVWGLRIKPSVLAWEGDADHERPYAMVRKAHPRAFAAGVVLLLAGLALQVVAALL